MLKTTLWIGIHIDWTDISSIAIQSRIRAVGRGCLRTVLLLLLLLLLLLHPNSKIMANRVEEE